MRRNTRWSVITLAALVLGTAAAACSSSSGIATTSAASSANATGDVAVTLNQWSVTPTVTPAAGSVTFTVTNAGSITHEFVVLKTDTQSSDIPIGKFEGEAGRINEDTAGTNVGETGDMQPGATSSLTLHLAPGHYVFLCNLPGHYMQGMHVDVTVK